MIAEKKPLQLTAWESTLARYLRAYAPGLTIQSLEEPRVVQSIIRVADYMGQKRWGQRSVFRWSAVSACEYKGGEQVQMEGADLFETVTAFVENKDDFKTTSKAGILILADVAAQLKSDASNVRLLREAAERITQLKLKKTIVIMGAGFKLPVNIRADYPVLEFEIPSTEHLYQYFNGRLSKIADGNAQFKVPTEEVLRDFATACTGLTQTEALATLSLVLAKFGKLDEQGIKMARKEKARAVLLAGGALTMVDPKYTLESVGGLDNLKGWINSVSKIVKEPEDARKFGLHIPSGLLIVGISGGGKSLVCEALASHWKLPFLRFDVGATYGKYVGESEGNLRQMQAMAEAVRPCVIQIDEIEKAFGGDGNDGGTSNRIKQSMLTWLQEKSDEIFVVATANDLTKLNSMPELIRAGRFDQTFFVDLPDKKSRQDILAIHMDRAGHDVDGLVLFDVAMSTEGYSGAELESIVQGALRRAFEAGEAEPTAEHFEAALGQCSPLSATMAEAVESLRAWCRDGRAIPAGRTLEQDAEAEAKLDSDDPSLIME